LIILVRGGISGKIGTMSKEQRERLPVSVSAAVFIEDSQGRLLLLQQAAEYKGKKWGPPAGGMHAHENPIDTVLRETKEEIGVEVELINLIGIYTADRGDNATGIAFCFRAKIVGGEIAPKEGEIMNFSFFTPAEVQEIIKKDQLYKPEYNLPTLKDWLDGHSHPLGIVKPLRN